jgi:hypothetical protein
MVAQQVDVVVHAHLVEVVIRAIPLLDDLLHHVIAAAESKTDRALIRLPAGIGLDLNDHFLPHYPTAVPLKKLLPQSDLLMS